MELWTWKSYTTFDYVDCALSDTLLAASDTLKVSVMIKNTGRCDGKEVVQLYVRDKVSTVATPIQQLKAFQKFWSSRAKVNVWSFLCQSQN